MITYEQGLRFLMDYLQGDDYYKLPPGATPDFNLVRARNQFALLACMEAREADMRDTVHDIVRSMRSVDR